jgi:hypothetical protein
VLDGLGKRTILHAGTARIHHGKQRQAVALAGVGGLGQHADLLVLRDGAEIDMHADRVGAAAQAVLDVGDRIFVVRVCRIARRRADVHDDGELGVDRPVEVAEPALMNHDGVGAIVGNRPDHPVVGLRVGEGPVRQGVIDRNNEGGGLLALQQALEPKGLSGPAHA